MGNSLRQEDQGDERQYLAWTDEEPVMVDIDPGQTNPAAHHHAPTHIDSQLKKIQEEISRMEREAELMNSYMFYNDLHR